MKRCAWCKSTESSVRTADCGLSLCCICEDEHNRDCKECHEIKAFNERADYDYDRHREEEE